MPRNGSSLVQGGGGTAGGRFLLRYVCVVCVCSSHTHSPRRPGLPAATHTGHKRGCWPRRRERSVRTCYTGGRRSQQQDIYRYTLGYRLELSRGKRRPQVFFISRSFYNSTSPQQQCTGGMMMIINASSPPTAGTIVNTIDGSFCKQYNFAQIISFS